MSFFNAKKHLEKMGLAERIMEFQASCRTVSEAALTIGCREEEIAKTLAFFVLGKPILIVAAGHVKIDNHKLKETFHQKVEMIPMEEVDKMIGHEVGGVCPFGIHPGVSVYLDVSLKENQIVYPACGNANSAVLLSIEELERASGYVSWIDVCKKNPIQETVCLK